jgi:hypothetical protein
MNRPRNRHGGGWIHLLFAVCLLGGLAFGARDSNDVGSTPGHRDSVTVTERCEPVTLDLPADEESARLLTDAGWTARGSHLYPPGCESAP